MVDKVIITNADRVLNAMQNIELDILKEFDRICRKHEIKYSLGGGTNLGQVRHGGFIPWDDDIDVDMTFDNYEKFMHIVNDELDSEKFFCRCRKNEPKHLRSASRLEKRGTSLTEPIRDANNENVGVFIDIFRWSYLPNNRLLRKIVTSSMFFVRGMEHWKEYKKIPAKAKKSWHFPIIFLSSILPSKFIISLDDMLCKCCGKRKTDWIIDDAIINGNHGGYKAIGIDEYEDVEFEGLTVMIKKNSHNFLKTLYGEHYNEWLPPVKRLSHHKWTKVDFGEYSEKYNLPENYSEFLSIQYTEDKLKLMKKISTEMIDILVEICEKYKFTFFRVEPEHVDNEKFANLWRRPDRLAMPREDYDRLVDVCQNEMGDKYFLQTTNVDPNYRFEHARIRLNYTYLKENNIPLEVENVINSGFFISVVPLDDTSNVLKKREKHLKNIKRWNHFLSIRWIRRRPLALFHARWKNKIKILLVWPFSNDFFTNRVKKEQARYRNTNSKYWIDGTGMMLKGAILNKDEIESGHTIYVDFNCEPVETISEYAKLISEKYNRCHLTYFDYSDYQLSMIRFDEVNDKILTNMEVLGYE